MWVRRSGLMVARGRARAQGGVCLVGDEKQELRTAASSAVLVEWVCGKWAQAKPWWGVASVFPPGLCLQSAGRPCPRFESSKQAPYIENSKLRILKPAVAPSQSGPPRGSSGEWM